MDEAILNTLIDTKLEEVREKYGENISQEEALKFARDLANNLLEEITDMKEDFEFTVCSGREPNQYTAGVKVWECVPNIYHISGYWDMPNAIADLGTPVTKHELTLTPGNLPPGVMKEVQNILFLGIETMTEQGLRISQRELKRVHNMCKNGN